MGRCNHSGANNQWVGVPPRCINCLQHRALSPRVQHALVLPAHRLTFTTRWTRIHSSLLAWGPPSCQTHEAELQQR